MGLAGLVEGGCLAFARYGRPTLRGRPRLPRGGSLLQADKTRDRHAAGSEGQGARPDAEGGNRTHTPRGEPDFESGASTSSATSAWLNRTGRPSGSCGCAGQRRVRPHALPRRPELPRRVSANEGEGGGSWGSHGLTHGPSAWRTW